MKIAVVLFTIIGLGLSAPQPRKLFHEHVDDFLDVIQDEAGSEIQDLMNTYVDYDEFIAAFTYMKTNNFKDLVKEMEHLPEFQAVIDFLEKDNIDIHFFLDKFDEMLEDVEKRSRQTTSGKDFASFVKDTIALFPKDKLDALYQTKLAEDEEFATAMENLNSPEWATVFNNLWENEIFKAEMDTLAEYGIDVNILLYQIVAIFGQ